MQNLTSLNFEPLRVPHPELADMGGHAEHYAHSDPQSALVKLRSFAERLVDHIYQRLRLARAPQSGFADLLRNEAFCMVVADRLVLDKLHLLRRLGNHAAHGNAVGTADALRCVYEAWQLARWLHVGFLGGRVEDFAGFREPPAEGLDSKAAIKRKVRTLAEQNALKEARLKAALEELAALRAADAARQAQAADADAGPPPDAARLREAAGAASARLRFSEDDTRKWLIDRDLRAAGWDVPLDGGSSDAVGQEVEVPHPTTASGRGYCDYVLWDDDRRPLAVVEAKRTTVDARAGQEQARQYADALERMHGHRPMIFFTNGHEIRVWDDAAGYPPRMIYGFWSKDTLQYRAGFQRRERRALASLRPDPQIAGRLYQIESLTRVAERFDARHRQALIVQATGTGKTRVAIALAKLLIEARWAKRVLFLCDRRELRRQARNAFREHLQEPIHVIGESDARTRHDARIYIGIYQGLLNDFESFDTGFFDLVIADESHRSIYNLYGELFKYFDALQVGLTATPIEMVSRSTCRLFGCEERLPTANYPLEQAIADGHLVPFRVVAHTTRFLREGIKAAHLSDAQIAELEEQGIDPNTLDFDAREIDEAVFNKDTNRVILRNLMERGLRDADGQLPGKSIVFARNIAHARLLAELFDEMHPQFAGRLCRVIHSEEPRAEDLIDEFRRPSGLRIAISVDMLDTGIDVPEVVNLVFAKPVRSKVKFWQMIGRGTRLCPDLFGPGRDKTGFLIFDHWGNFDFHELDAEEVEPRVPKPLTQRRYEARLALQRDAPRAFELLAGQLRQDALALPDGAIGVRERWQAVEQARDAARLHRFDAATRQMLLESVAPLMNALDARGQGEAWRWDLLLARAQAAALERPGEPNPQRGAIVEWIGRLPPRLKPVRDREEALRLLRSDDWWREADFMALERMREALREVMVLAEPGAQPPPLPTPVLDLHEERAGFVVEERPTRIRSVDYEVYRRAVQAALEPHFDTEPALRRIRAGEPVSEAELDRLNSLLHTASPGVDLATLREFFPDTALPLGLVLRAIVGLDAAAVEARFADFAQRHRLDARQLRFLALLKEHIRQHGAIATDRLFGPPFTALHAAGLDGVFPLESQFQELVGLVRSFGEPVPAAAAPA